MKDSPIPQFVLSEALEKAINGRRVKSAVFFTFEFDPGFFEQEIVPLLFNQSFSHAEKIKTVQLEEKLRELEHLAVYYDRRALVPGAQPARLAYKRIDLTRTGYFHPKNILLLLENSSDPEIDSLLFGTLSANLTRSGWWENVEVAHIEEIDTRRPSRIRNDLLALINLVRSFDKTGEDHFALESIRKFLVYRVIPTDTKYTPAIYFGKDSIPDFLDERVRHTNMNFEIISPFLDTQDSPGTVSRLIEKLKPRETRIFLPEDRDGSALCRQGYFAAISNLPNVYWSRLPPNIVQASSKSRGVETRHVHAKVYRIWSEDLEYLFVGSANLTQAAHSRGDAGNFETGILIKHKPDSRPRWLLEKLGDRVPDLFQEPGEEGSETDTIAPLTLRYHWNAGKLEYFWDSSAARVPEQVTISSQNVPLFGIAEIQPEQWMELPSDHAEKIRELLKSTSFVEGSMGDEAFRVLIREEDMAYKPSLLMQLTAEDILQYWSLLSPEQKEAFLSERLPDLSEEHSKVLLEFSRKQKIDSMFDRFAGIFHAFGRLEEHVANAIESAPGEAIYRLFGQKYDSLPHLVEMLLEDQNGDRVNKYVELLCAKQLLERISRNFTDFSSKHRTEISKLRKSIDEGLNLSRTAFSFDDKKETDRFLEWFEKMFSLEVTVPEEADA